MVTATRKQNYSLSDLIFAEKAKRSLETYIEQAWHIVEPTTEYVPGWHIGAIAEHLEAVIKNQIQNLIINIPPRHMKSLEVCVFFPSWAWINQPSLRFMFASYALQLSVRDSRKTRNVIESPWYRENYGHIYKLVGDQNVKGRFENDKTGVRLAVSVDSAATGEGGDVIVCDDAHNVIEVGSDIERNKVIQWWTETMSSRLNDQKTGHKIIVGQRVHDQDLTGYLIEQGGYELLKLPAEYEGNKYITSIGWQDPRNQEKELLWPLKIGEKENQQLKKEVGDLAYSAQYQQDPVPGGGTRFREEWFRYYRVYHTEINGQIENVYELLKPDNNQEQVEQKDLTIFVTCDLAVSVKQTADYTVYSVWGRTPNADLLLLDMFRDRMEAPDQLKNLKLLDAKWNPKYIGIESTAYQLSLVQYAKRAGLTVRELKADKDKISRSIPASIRMQNGQIFFPIISHYMTEVKLEIIKFPLGAHDDIVDTLSYACIKPDVIRDSKAQVPDSWI